MNQKKLMLAALLLFGTVVSCNRPQKTIRTPKPYTSEQLRNNVSIQGAGISPNDSAVLDSNNASGIFNVQEINVKDTTTKVLTKSVKESFFAVDYLPRWKSFYLFSRSRWR